MDFEENMVSQNDNVEAEDSLPEEIVEEEPGEPEESLESLTDEGQPAEEEQPEQPKAKEPGYVKGRIEKAVAKAVAETEARMQAMFDAQMAPLREKMLNDEAEKLVSQGIVKDLETAKELVRYRQGQSAQPVQPAQPSTEQAQQEDDPATAARVRMLQHQADVIRGKNGPDVIAEFQSNEDIKQKVISGEMDFYDVAEYMKGKPQKKKVQAPMRSPNGAGGSVPNAIDTMTDEQFDRMERNISEKGARYSLR